MFNISPNLSLIQNFKYQNSKLIFFCILIVKLSLLLILLYYPKIDPSIVEKILPVLKYYIILFKYRKNKCFILSIS